MSGRRVVFRESPPSSGVSSRYNTSDSGHGSASDTTTSRYSSGGGGGSGSGASGSQWTDLPALQDAYRAVLAERNEWKIRAEELEAEVVEAQKLTSEAEAKWRAMVESNEQLEDEKKKLFKENKELKMQVDEVDDLQDQVDDLNEKLAEANARFNEMQLNPAPAYGAPGTSPHHHSSDNLGHADNMSSTSGTKSSSRHGSGKERESKSSSKSSSNAGSGTSSGSSSHGSSRAKVGSSSSSTGTAKLSRSGSSRHGSGGDRDRERDQRDRDQRDRDHQPAKDQKTRLSQRFDHKDDGLIDSNASASSAASSSSQKHHKSGSSGQGSSGSNTSADSMGMRPSPPQMRARRGSYVEGYGPGPDKLAHAGLATSQRSSNSMMQTPISPNKGVPRSTPTQSVMGVAGVPTAGGYGYHAGGYAQPPPQGHQGLAYGAPAAPTSSGLMSPRGDNMGKDTGMRPKVHIVSDMTPDPYQQDPQYYSGYNPVRDPRGDPRLPRR